MKTVRRLFALSLVVAVVATGCSGGNELDDLRRRLDEEGRSSSTDGDAAHVQPPPRANPNLTGRVGLVVATNSPTWRSLVEAPADDGVVVLFVQPDGPSDGKGLERGDVITHVDTEPSRNAELAVVQLRAEPGEDRVLSIAKKGDGGTEDVTVTAERPGDVDLMTFYAPMVEEEPDNPVLRFLVAQAGGGFQESLDHADQAVDLSPGFVEAISLRAELLWNQSRLEGIDSDTAQEYRDRAMNDWALALELDPENTRVIVSRSQALSQGGASREGKSEAEKAIELDETFPGAYYALGLAEISRSRYAAAAEPLRKAIDLTPYDVRYYELLALAFVNLGRREDAQRTVDAIIHLVDDQGARQRLESIPETGRGGSSSNADED